MNGELTNGENIADLGGLRLAYAALKRAQSPALAHPLPPSHRSSARKGEFFGTISARIRSRRLPQPRGVRCLYPSARSARSTTALDLLRALRLRCTHAARYAPLSPPLLSLRRHQPVQGLRHALPRSALHRIRCAAERPSQCAGAALGQRWASAAQPDELGAPFLGGCGGAALLRALGVSLGGRTSLGGAMDSPVDEDGFTPAQRFFLGWAQARRLAGAGGHRCSAVHALQDSARRREADAEAVRGRFRTGGERRDGMSGGGVGRWQVWRANITPQEASQRLVTDPHAPHMMR